MVPTPASPPWLEQEILEWQGQEKQLAALGCHSVPLRTTLPSCLTGIFVSILLRVGIHPLSPGLQPFMT